MKKYRDHFLYFITKNRKSINFIFGTFLIIATILWVNFTTKKELLFNDIDSWWGGWGDPILGVSTFLIALVIWLTNIAKDWEERLDKKVSVSYLLVSDNNREVIRCENAFLAHEGDIRNWGQSLGQQTIGKNTQNRLVYFDYSNTIKMDSPEVVKNNSEFYKHYTATFFLKNLPTDNLANGKKMLEGKFIWKSGVEQAEFIRYIKPLQNQNDKV